MSKSKAVALIVLFASAAGAVFWASGFFRAPAIQVLTQVRPLFRVGAPKTVVSFTLDHPYELSSVKVVPLDEWTANHNVQPCWELKAKGRSKPTRGFVYGWRIRGMAPAKGIPTRALEPGKTYRLLVKAGRAQGSADFQLPSP